MNKNELAQTLATIINDKLSRYIGESDNFYFKVGDKMISINIKTVKSSDIQEVKETK